MIAELHRDIQGIPCINDCDMDTMLRVYGDFHHFIVDNQNTKDWLIGYGMVNGKALSVLLPENPKPVNHPVLRVTFPFLDLSLL